MARVDKIKPHWPGGFLSFLAAGGMMFGLLTAFFPPCRILFPMNVFLYIGVHVLGSVRGIQIMMLLAVVIHAFEAYLIRQICKNHNLNKEDVLGWVWLTLVIGYPAIAELKHVLSLKNA
uniref:Uncharacterized protein n=1 Tax=Polytomella parva TaxID=51329 RepID=A0A7S0UP28_9CHLO|mmetsp:Transcript_10837/g.19755  ORF Transcript_10837/g.19755 Transcript_10837/m.19755 type:complete len:119 (+) Transcript_10837:86-442(+)